MPTGIYERTDRHRAINARNARRGTTEERFAAKVSMEPGEDGCHLWTGSLSEKGYGTFCNEDGHCVKAHVWADNRANGPIPPGLERDHRCNVRRCVNTAHIERVTHAENLRRIRERRLA